MGAGRVTQTLKDMVVLSVTKPREAATRILALPLGTEALWTAFALVAVINTLLYSLSITLFEASTGMKTGMNVPALYLALLSAAMLGGAMAIAWIGRALGGKATLMRILPLVIWLQVLRAIAQLGLIVAMLVAPGLANALSVGVGLYGLWLMANFLDVAQGWKSLGKSFLVMVLTGLVFVFALSLFMALVGATAMGM